MTFGSAVNEGLKTLDRAADQADQGGVDPAPRLDAVQAANHELELHVEVVVLVLDLAVMRCDADALDTLLHEGGRHVGLGLADIGLAEQKLPV